MLPTPPLQTLTLEITKFCPLNCLHCSTLAGEDVVEELTLDEIKTVIDDFVSLGGKDLEVSGGEPLGHKYIWETLRYAKESNLRINLFTCGILGPDVLDTSAESKQQETFAKKIKELNVDKVTVSIYGSSSETHDSITQKSGSFKSTIKFIEALIRNGNRVGIHFVPMNPNFEELEYIITLAEMLNVEDVHILRFVPQGRGKLNEKWLKLSPAQSMRLIEMITEIRRKTTILKVGSHLDFSFLLDESIKPKPCTAGIDKCLIQPDGNVIPCAVFKGLGDYIAGNIRASSLSQIWRESKVFSLLRGFSGDKLKGLCSTCEHLEVCKGRCPAQRAYEYKDFYQGPDPYCPQKFKEEATIEKQTSIKKIVILGSCRFEKEINKFVEKMKGKYLFLAIPKTLEKHNTEEGYLEARKIFEPAIKECDEVWVWNQDGYIGEHTLRDIQLASYLKKKIKFMFP